MALVYGEKLHAVSVVAGVWFPLVVCHGRFFVAQYTKNMCNFLSRHF